MRYDVHHLAPCAILGDIHLLMGQSIGNKNIVLIIMRNAIALRAQPVDGYLTCEF